MKQALLLQVAQLALLQQKACSLALHTMICYLILPVQTCEALQQVQVQMVLLLLIHESSEHICDGISSQSYSQPGYCLSFGRAVRSAVYTAGVGDLKNAQKGMHGVLGTGSAAGKYQVIRELNPLLAAKVRGIKC